MKTAIPLALGMTVMLLGLLGCTAQADPCPDGCEHEGRCYSVGEYLAANDAICEESGWTPLPSKPNSPPDVSG